MTDADSVEAAAEWRDPALVVSIAELTRRAGNRRRVHIATRLHAPAVAEITVPADEPVTGELELESMLDAIVVTGTLNAPWTGACRRCLDPISDTVDVVVRELFEDNATPGESYPISGDQIDLSPMVHDAVLLSLPLSPLCRTDCEGPDPERFPASVVLDDLDEPVLADPRWAALTALHFEDDPPDNGDGSPAPS